MILNYKGKPFVRKDKDICYGDVNDKYVLVLTVLEAKEERGISVATRVRVQLQSTDDSLSANERIIKFTERPSLFEAFDVGEVWLERSLAAN